jgi:hypothetical protein
MLSAAKRLLFLAENKRDDIVGAFLISLLA